MKFSTSISALCVVLPLISSVVGGAIPEAGLARRQGQRNRGGRGRGGNNNNNNQNNNNNNNAGAGADAGADADAGNNNQNQNNNQNNNNQNNNNQNNNNNEDPQTSLTLDPRVIAPGFANDGQDVPAEGQVASLTSTNNFINFCLTVPDLPITDGKQITTGSCNPAPIGVIPNVDTMPSSKFTFPENFGNVQPDTPFTVTMAIRNLAAGNFVNAQANYFAAPQQLNGQGVILGHTHFVIEEIDALTDTNPTNPRNFAFFKGVNTAQVNGEVSADVTAGLPAGTYRLCSINTSSNHQPVIVPVAQHGALDDCIYFTAGAANNNNNNQQNNNNNNDNAADNNNDNAGADAGAGNAADNAGQNNNNNNQQNNNQQQQNNQQGRGGRRGGRNNNRRRAF